MPGYDYEKLFFAYRLIAPQAGGPRKLKVRTCPDCGEVLAPRRRYCDKCRRKHEKTARRDCEARRRKSRRPTVES